MNALKFMSDESLRKIFVPKGTTDDILLEKVDLHESAHGIAVIYGVLYAFIGQVEPALQQIHPEHDLDKQALRNRKRRRNGW